MKDKKTAHLTEQQMLPMAIDSVRSTGKLDLFYKTLRMLRVSSHTLHKAKELVVKHNGLIFRTDRDVNLDNPAAYSYETSNPYTGRVEGSPLDGFRARTIDKSPLVKEIPNYLDVIQGRGMRPTAVYVLEHTHLDHGSAVTQPVFKVVAEYGGAHQLFIVGRDRHTREPFALGVPNGLVDFPIHVCLNWTMSIHKGDIAVEV